MVAGQDSGRRILVVEDDVGTRDMLRKFLQGQGYSVATAANGREALAYLRSQPQPDLILLDLLMPVMSGGEFRREQLRDPTLASIPVLILSVVDDIGRHANALNVMVYLRKPINLDMLLTTVRACFKPS